MTWLPRFTIGPATIDLADVVVLAAVLAAIGMMHFNRRARAALRGAWPLWLAAAAFLVDIAAGSLYPRLADRHYAWSAHIVTAIKYAEYAALAPALVVAFATDRRAGRRVCAAVIVTGCLSALVLILQFVGVRIFDPSPPWQAEPSFIGNDQSGSLGIAAIAIGAASLMSPSFLGRRARWLAFVAGAINVIVCGALASEVGLVAALVTMVALLIRRSPARVRDLALLSAIAVVCALGLAAIRGGDIYQFVRYVGLARPNSTTHSHVQTYAQRTLMLYIGYRVWRAHPVFGAGWQSIREEHVYAPFLAAAHRQFPDQPPEAFPAPQHTWAIDNGYLQTLADLGLAGLACLLVLLVVAAVGGARTCLRAPPEGAAYGAVGLLWIVLVAGLWTGQSNVAGAPRDAIFWLGAGLVGAHWRLGRNPTATHSPSSVAPG
ncbi:MAG: O-antigen ligase family protein [Actinobacteria bacterium]|nr:O-antigen ligase family protein [Actinomycetota bacterium]